MSNLCRGRPKPPLQRLRPAIPVIAELVKSSDLVAAAALRIPQRVKQREGRPWNGRNGMGGWIEVGDIDIDVYIEMDRDKRYEAMDRYVFRY